MRKDAADALAVMTREPIITAVIVNHEHWPAPLRQLDGYRRHAPAIFDAMDWRILHNGPEAPIGIEGLPANVRYERAENRGYGAAVNQAIAASQSPFVLALNADLEGEPEFLFRLMELVERLGRQENQRIGVVGPRLQNVDGSPQLSVGEFPNLARVLAGLLRPRDTRKFRLASAGMVPWVSGACMLLRRACLDEIGPFDEQFFMYYEDVDLCLRATLANWKVAFEPSCQIRHLFPYHSRALTLRLVALARRSMLFYFWKHRPHWEFRVLGQVALAECRLRKLQSAPADLAGWDLHRDLLLAQLANPACPPEWSDVAFGKS